MIKEGYKLHEVDEMDIHFGSSLQVILMKWRRLQQMKFLGCDLFSKKAVMKMAEIGAVELSLNTSNFDGSIEQSIRRLTAMGAELQALQMLGTNYENSMEGLSKSMIYSHGQLKHRTLN